IAGLECGAHGHVRFGDENWQSEAPRLFVPAHRRDVALVFQDARLFPHLNVAGNLRFADRRAPRDRAEPAFEDVIAALGLGPLLGRSTTTLSGGERQRVAIGRALLSRPRLLLLDEPLSALDIRRRDDILGIIAALPARFGIPLIHVSHSIDEVARLADRILVLADGRVIADGAAAAILERPDLQHLTGRFEAGVRLEARIVSHDPRWLLTRLDVDGQTVSVPAVAEPPGTPVRLRVRARDVALATEPPRGLSVRNVLSGRILAIEAAPDTPFAEITIDLGRQHLRARLTRESVAELGLDQGVGVHALIKTISFDGQSAGTA
ncbi:MAG: molybdenum ABC transporter ATP-binding protein, partial [Pseudomonadota bacterium]|nr:molybdenum ABC transporter ATP-binding protein [Pseudomonadota bacterium]